MQIMFRNAKFTQTPPSPLNTLCKSFCAANAAIQQLAPPPFAVAGSATDPLCQEMDLWQE